MKNSNWKSEFEEYKNAAASVPPVRLSDEIRKVVAKDLNAMPWKVFSKLALIHLVSALLTLSFCPQFGFRVFGEGMGLMENFMGFGAYGCMLACGFFFMGSSLLMAALVLKSYELMAIRRHRFAEIGSIVLLSMGFFIMVGAEEVLTGYTLAWMTGAIAGGVTLLELGWAARKFARVGAKAF